jgi:hypothetical protein
MGEIDRARADIDKYRAESMTKRTRGTSPADMDLYGKASVGEFAGGAGTFTPGGRARELSEAKRLRGSRKDPAQAYGSGEGSTAPRSRIVGGKAQVARPGAALELEKLKKEWRSKPSKTRGPIPTEKDVENYWVPKGQKTEAPRTEASAQAEKLLRNKRRRKRSTETKRVAEKEARQKEAARAQKSFNDEEIAFLSSIDDIADRDEARKMLLDAREKGITVTRDAKGEFVFKTDPGAKK